MDYPFAGGALPFGWRDVPTYWPQRLIRIDGEELVSVPRGAENIYEYKGTFTKEPKYNTLSYTWGRWRLRYSPGEEPMYSADDPPTLPIQNTPWNIPVVDKEHFTVATFRKIVKKMEQEGVEWVWIDVGCIGQSPNAKIQENDLDKSQLQVEIDMQAAVEVGRQVSIFKQAKSTFVWLSKLKRAELIGALDVILDQSENLDIYVWRTTSGTIDINIDTTIQKLHESHEHIFRDPWFSSLWTLQEVVLRNDAIVLSAEGDFVPWKVTDLEEQRMYMTMFINHCQNVYECLERLLQGKLFFKAPPLSDDTAHMAGEVQKMIRHAGFYYLFSTNPNVQYGTARHRKTKRKHDRVYAIMQIYNLRVGKAARPDENPSLEELALEFSGAINQRSAILGQMFIHTEQPRPDRSWQITEASTVPNDLMLYSEPKDMATIRLEKNANGVVSAVATGKCCPLPTLVAMAKLDGGLDKNISVGEWGLGFKIFLDSHIGDSNTFTSPTMRHVLERCDHQKLDYDNVLVLWLGNVQAEYDYKVKAFSRRNIGVLLYPVDGDNGEEKYERLGVVSWFPGCVLFRDRYKEDYWQSHDRINLF